MFSPYVMSRSKKVLWLLCSFIALFLWSFAVPDGEEDGIRIKRIYDSTCACGYEYMYEDFSERLLGVHKLYKQSQTKHGVSYSFDEKGDTTDISYYNMDEIAPLYLSQKKGNKLGNVSEYIDGVAVDNWRNEYSKISVRLSRDSAWVYYAFKDGKKIFDEVYDNGKRISRTITNQQRYDSVIRAYYSVTGEEIFQRSCTSCHRIGTNATGPALKGITKRHAEIWLRSWIANPAKMISEKDPAALKLYHDWNGTGMLSFPFDKPYMDKLLAYLKTL